MPLLQTLTRVGQAFIERRRATRHDASCPAWIEFDGDTAPRECVLIDVSDGGARVEFARPEDLPDEFSLVQMEDAEVRRCRVVWRSEGQVGVRYLKPRAR